MQIRTPTQVVLFVVAIGAVGLTLVNGLNYIALSPSVFAAQARIANAQVLMMTLICAPYFALKFRQVSLLSEQLAYANRHDHLTKAHTRAYLYEALDANAAWPCGIVLTDIDHFKAINDTFGHLAGDAVLMAVVERLRAHAGPEGIVARFGGEEFVIALPGQTLAEAEVRAEQMRQSIAACPISHEGQLIAVTASFGVALAAAPITVPNTLRAADGALYAAKAAGRNRVERLRPPQQADAERPDTAQAAG